MNIKLMRLSTGEDLIGDVTGTFTKNQGTGVKTGITVENPCIVYITQTQTGGHNVGLTRWMPYADNKTFEIDDNFIVTIAEPAADLAKQYDQVFGSGIIVPQQGIEIPTV